MRRLLPLAAAALLLGCPPPTPPNPPPPQAFYFPTGVAHVDVPGTNEGVLLVASANFDRRFDHGALTAIDLDKVGGLDGSVLPVFGATVPPTGPVQVRELNVGAQSVVAVASFAGELGTLAIDGGTRVFVPTRSEGHHVYAIDLFASDAGAPLSCVAPSGSAVPAAGTDCRPQGMSLVVNEKSATGVPAAPSPQAVSVGPDGTVWVSHMTQADSPRGSLTNQRGYLVRFDGRSPFIDDSSFVLLGEGATHAVAAGQRWTYASGRFLTPAALLVRFTDGSGRVINSALESAVGVLEGRGLTLSSDETRLFVVGRVPDQLLVASIEGPGASQPRVRVIRSLPLPEGPTTVALLPRPGRSDLVAITCSSSGSLVIYDDERGELVAQVAGLGLQPYAIGVDLRGVGARLYVSNFSDGRVAVLDIPSLDRPQEARLVAHLGQSQLCLTRGTRDGSCDGGVR